MSEKKYISVFKRLERDHEFRDRLVAEHGVAWSDVRYKMDDDLDAWAWHFKKVQRKILEDVA